MSLDCGLVVFVHIPRTGGQWTRTILNTVSFGEIGGYHAPPETFLPSKLYFCWERNRKDWIKSIETYLSRDDHWWEARTPEPTWGILRNMWMKDRGNFRDWLVSDFLNMYYDTGIRIVPFDDRIVWLSKWVDPDRVWAHRKPENATLILSGD